MNKSERATKESMPVVEVSLEKSLVDLAKEFELSLIEGENLIEQYMKQEEVSYEDLFNHIKKLQNISRLIQGGLTLQINRYYGKTRNTQTLKNLQELGYDTSPGT